MHVRIINHTHPYSPLITAKYCDRFLCRLKGLMFSQRLGEQEALLLVEPGDSRLGSSIHMFFMQFDIGVVWINSFMQVVDRKLAHRWQSNLSPRLPARFILEMHPSQLENFSIGDEISFEPL